MKKRTLLFIAGISLLMFSGCTSNQGETAESSAAKTEATSSKKAEVKASITLLDGDQELSKKEITFEKGESLFDALKENYEVEDDDGMITSIDGHAQDKESQKYWVFTVNDKEVNVGAKEVELKAGDRVVFKLEQF